MRFLIATASFVTPAIAVAEQIDPIIVIGRSLDAPIGIDAYDSVVIKRDRLALNASGRIEDVLGDVAGFQQFRRVDSRAANPTSQGATLRALGGNASSRALVLLDGVPQADPFTGYIPYSALRPERLAAEVVAKPPVLLVHGDQDPVVPFADMGLAGDALVAAGFETFGHVMAGTGHGIAPDGLGAALQFLRERLQIGS